MAVYSSDRRKTANSFIGFHLAYLLPHTIYICVHKMPWGMARRGNRVIVFAVFRKNKIRVLSWLAASLFLAGCAAQTPSAPAPLGAAPLTHDSAIGISQIEPAERQALLA